MYQQNKPSEFKVKFQQASNCCKRVLEVAKLAYSTETKEFINSQKLGSWDFWRIDNSVLNKVEYAITPLFNGPDLLSSASDKVKLFAKNFSKKSNRDDSGISWPIFSSRTNLKLHNISITRRMVEKVKTNLDSSKASGPDCIPLVVLKNCEPELSYILPELFSMCLEESCFPDCWKVSLAVPVFKNVGERSTDKNYHPVSHLSMVSKVLEKLVNNRIVDHLDGKPSQEYLVNAGVPQGSILGATLFLLQINVFRDDIICNIAIYADDTTLYSKNSRNSAGFV